MKKLLSSLLILLAFTVYLKQTAYTTYLGWGKFGPPHTIELKEIKAQGEIGVHGTTKDGKDIFIPMDSIAWIEET